MSQSEMISIIVPVYNAENYIDQCIKSVLDQSYQNIELILIDDGSRDGSLKICRAWERDPRVKVISTENHGVSHARNLGVEQAAGAWIMFLDSDDYLLPGCLEGLMAMASADTQEILGAYLDGGAAPEGTSYQSVSADQVRIMSLDSINNHLLPSFYEVKPLSLPACWAKLFRSNVIKENNIRFHEKLRLSEDMLFHLDYLACIDRVVVTNLPVLFYRRNESSVTKVFKPEHLDNRFRFFDLLQKRNHPEAAVHILSLLLFEVCKIQRYTAGRERKRLEDTVAAYLADNQGLLHSVGNRALSEGKGQQIAYRCAVACFRLKLNFVGFALLRLYAVITKGEINKIVNNETSM